MYGPETEGGLNLSLQLMKDEDLFGWWRQDALIGMLIGWCDCKN